MLCHFTQLSNVLCYQCNNFCFKTNRNSRHYLRRTQNSNILIYAHPRTAPICQVLLTLHNYVQSLVVMYMYYVIGGCLILLLLVFFVLMIIAIIYSPSPFKFSFLDHISPAGSISRNSPAARYLSSKGLEFVNQQ